MIMLAFPETVWGGGGGGWTEFVGPAVHWEHWSDGPGRWGRHSKAESEVRHYTYVFDNFSRFRLFNA